MAECHFYSLEESSYSLVHYIQVTNKSDMSDFYRNLLKSNVAFGARNVPKPTAAEKDSEPETEVEDEELKPSTSTGEKRPSNKEETNYSSATRDRNDTRSPSRSRDDADKVVDTDGQKSNVKEKSAADTTERVPEEAPEVPKRPAVDPVAAAKERYLARKRQRGL